MAIRTTPVDVSEYIGTPDAQAEFIAAAFESGDRAHIGRAIGEVARARGMTAIAKDAGLSREALYRALSADGDPRLSTLLGVMKALGLHLSTAPTDKAA
jgi:probable addiction module antidote protein